MAFSGDGGLRKRRTCVDPDPTCRHQSVRGLVEAVAAVAGYRVMNVGDMQPSPSMPIDQAVALAAARRGIEGMRIVIPAQQEMAASTDEWSDQPMPMIVF